MLALDGGALSFVELMFHTRNAPRMPGRSDAAAMRDAAWQAAYERRGWAVTALDASAAVIDHVALITSPPDGRYSLLGAPAPVAPKQRPIEAEEGSAGEGSQEEQEQGWVRALVFSLDPPADGQAGEPLDVQLSGWLPNGVQLFSKPMQLQQAAGGSGDSSSSSDGGLLYAAQGKTTVSCVGAAGGPAAHCHVPADVVSIQVSGLETQGCGVCRHVCSSQALAVGGDSLAAMQSLLHQLSFSGGCNMVPLYVIVLAGQRQGPQRRREPLATPAGRAALHSLDQLAPALLGGCCGGAAAPAEDHGAGVGWPGLQLASHGAQVRAAGWHRVLAHVTL